MEFYDSYQQIISVDSRRNFIHINALMIRVQRDKIYADIHIMKESSK